MLLAAFAAVQMAHPTARETYIGCSLYVRDVELIDDRPEGERGTGRWIDASGCYIVAARALSDPVIDPSEVEGPTESLRFCPPESLNLSVHNIRPMAVAYLRYFERRASDVADRPTFPVFLQAMAERWPCPAE